MFAHRSHTTIDQQIADTGMIKSELRLAKQEAFKIEEELKTF
jgi:hypothetical protein